MFYNYLKIAFRNLRRDIGFSIINILGLTLGLSVSLLIFLFVNNEITYDRYHKDADNIYRVNTSLKAGDFDMDIAATSPPLGPYLREHYPKVLSSVRFSTSDDLILEYDDNKFEEEIVYVDSTLFDVFTIDVINGNPEIALIEPFSLVITETKAKKYFGNTNPIGRIITANNGHNYTVTCVIKDWPQNSHLYFQMMSTFECIDILHMPGPPTSSWIGFNYTNYIKLADDYSPSELEAEFAEILKKYIDSDPIAQQFKMEIKFFLQPLTRIHLFSDLIQESEIGGSIINILVYSAIGLFILLIACINFMNLSTARSAKRLREVGIRKVVGAYRGQLIGQFLTESILISIISLILALTLAELLLPEFNTIINKNLRFDYLNQWPLTLGFIGIALLVGIIAGSYPALYLSGFKPVAILQGKMKIGSGGVFFRNILVVFQFVISIILINSTGVVFKQINFVKNTDLGFDIDNILIIPLRGENIEQKPEFFKNELKSIPEISDVAMGSGYPGRGGMQIMFKFEGFIEEEGKVLQFYDVDYDYLDLLDLDFVKGRNFDKEYALDESAVILNETLIKQLGWEDPIGKTVIMTDFVDEKPFDRNLHVIGVVKDFHFRSLHSQIAPVVFRIGDERNSYVFAKLSNENVQETIEKIKNIYTGIDQSWPFLSYFMDSRYESNYLSEVRQSKIFMYFTFLAIFIATLGLFGLASFIAEQRTKEIGIRKILGSSVGSIIKKLTINYLKLVLIASVIAIPVSWYIMDKWLQSFAYKVDISWWVFVLSTLAAMLIAFLTVLYKSLKVARSNPVDAIKFE